MVRRLHDHRAEVAKPALALSKRIIAFEYTWEQGLEPAQMAQPLEVRNVSALPLEVRLRTAQPFGVSQASLSLGADEGAIIEVTCDAALGCDPCVSPEHEPALYTDGRGRRWYWGLHVW